MKNVNSPTEMIVLLSKIVDDTANQDTLMIGFKETLFTSKIDFISTVGKDETNDAPILLDMEELIHSNEWCDKFVIVRGSDTVHEDNCGIETGIAEFIHEHEELLLDVLIVNWEKETYYSQICDDEEGCCGPNNQRLFTSAFFSAV